MDLREPIPIGISSCLLGVPVRYDGGHKHDAFLTGTLGRWVRWISVCPEVEAGMGVPRETVRLVSSAGGVRMVGTESGTDWTAAMRAYAERRVRELSGDELYGYVLKKNSPSCGMEGVKVYGEGRPTRTGRGLFAEALLQHYPNLPVEEEGSLSDPAVRDNFVERVFAYRRLRRLFAGRWRAGDLVAFHTAHKLQVMAHAPAAYRALGALVARTKSMGRSELRERYERELMRALAVIADRRGNTNVLLHIAGYFKKLLGPEDKRALQDLITEYRRGWVPLVVPLTLIRHYVRVHRVAYIAGQTYLEPHPKELMLRNHV